MEQQSYHTNEVIYGPGPGYRNIPRKRDGVSTHFSIGKFTRMLTIASRARTLGRNSVYYQNLLKPCNRIYRK